MANSVTSDVKPYDRESVMRSKNKEVVNHKEESSFHAISRVKHILRQVMGIM